MVGSGIGINESKNQYVKRPPATLYFDGVDDYIKIEGYTGSTSIPTLDVTHEFKLDSYGTGSNYQCLWALDSPTYCMLKLSDKTIFISLSTTGGQITTGTTFVLKLGVKYSIRVHCDGAMLRVYNYGELIAEKTFATNIFINSSYLKLGDYGGTGFSKFHGTMYSFIWQGVIQYNLDEFASDIAKDLSPNKYHGKIYGATWKPKPAEYSLTFDGVDDHIVIPQGVVDYLDTCTEATLQIKMKRFEHSSGTSTAIQGLIQLSGQEAANGTLYPYVSGTNLNVYIDVFKTTRVTATVPSTIMLNEWHWLTITTIATGLYEIYINDIKIAFIEAEPKVYAKTTLYPIPTLGRNSGTQRHFQGDMREFRLYDRYMPQEEVLTSQNAEKPSSNGLLLHWNFDEGAGDTLRDASGNNANVIFNGGANWKR